jgi:hypothetical protein
LRSAKEVAAAIGILKSAASFDAQAAPEADATFHDFNQLRRLLMRSLSCVDELRP